jgi:hypothetical protein
LYDKYAKSLTVLPNAMPIIFIVFFLKAYLTVGQWLNSDIYAVSPQIWIDSKLGK